MESAKRTKFRWLIIALILSLVVINYVDRAAIAYAIGPISESLGINAVQWGLVGSAFSVGYLLVAFLSGPMVDYFGPRKILAVAVLIWSVASLFTALASTFAIIFIARVLLGLGEGPGFPAASRATSRWVPKVEQGFVLSLIGGVGVAASVLISGPIVTYLIPLVGWRSTFLILGALGLVWLVVWVAVFRDEPSPRKGMNAEELAYIASGKTELEKAPTKSRIDAKKIFTNKPLLAMAVGFFSWGYIFWGLLYWLPGYLSQVYHLDIKAVGIFGVIPWATGICGALLGGFALSRMRVATDRFYPQCALMAGCVLLAGLCMIPVFLIHSLNVAILFISLGVGFGFVTAGFWWVASIETSPDQPGFAAGLVDAAFAAAGIVAPIVMGYVVEYTGNFNGGFLTMLLVAVAGALVMLVFTREVDQPR